MVIAMEQPIYGDVLFIINFSMDFLTLFIVGKIMHRAIKPLRYCLAAAIGALYGVSAVFLAGNSIISIFINIAVSVLMCYTAYESKVPSCTALFYCTGFLLGGGMTSIYHLANKTFSSGAVYAYGNVLTLSENIPLGYMAVIALLTGIAAIISGRISSRYKVSPSVIVHVFDSISKQSVEFEALTDSGNLLTEPISGFPVIITGRDTLAKIADESLMKIMSGDISDADRLDFGLMKKVRFIPISDTRGSGMIVGFIPSKITVNGIEVEACLALDRRDSNAKGNGYGGYSGIVPAILCGGSKRKQYDPKSILKFFSSKSNQKNKRRSEK